MQPRVTRIEGGGRVHIRNGEIVIEQSGGNQHQPQQPTQEQQPTTQATTKPDQSTPTPTGEVEPIVWPAGWMVNGSSSSTHAWQQSRDDVKIHVAVPQNACASARRGPALRVQVSVLPQRITVKVGDVVEFDAELSNEIEAGEEAVDGCWEIVDIPGDGWKRRAVCISVQKHLERLNGLAGDMLRIWWNRLLKDEEPTVDVSTIGGRDVKTAEAWKSAWSEAHEKFREQVAAKKEMMDVDDDDDDDGAKP